MSVTHDSDATFHDNLVNVAAGLTAPPGLSPESRARCLDALDEGFKAAERRKVPMYRRPLFVSTFAAAASLALAVTLLIPSFGTGPRVEAATILTKLTEQIAGQDVLEIELTNAHVDDVEVDARIQLAMNQVAGDVKAKIKDNGGEGVFNVDASFAIGEKGGWVLVRNLQIPDPEAMMFITMVMPPGSETLIHLPSDLVEGALDEKVGDTLSELRGAASGQLVTIVKRLLESQNELKAEATKRRDGLVELSVPLRDKATLEQFLRVVMEAMGTKAEDDMDIDGEEDLIGSTMRVVYDPKAERVRSVSLVDLGDLNGTLTLSLREGGIDPALIDPARVTTPQTRTFDLGALKSMIQGFQGQSDRE